MRIIPFRAHYPNLDFITSPDSFFESVRDEYSDHLANGFFHPTAAEGLYLYQIEGRGRRYTGLIAMIDIQDYLDGRIRKHEQTLTEKEQLQIQLLMKRNAIIKPILLGYQRVDAIEEWLEKQCEARPPSMEVVFEKWGETHRIWQMADAASLKYAQELFSRLVSHTYIADGHHRATIAAILHQRMSGQPEGNKYNRLMCALFGSDQLEILDFNRVIDGLRELSPTHFMARLGGLFKVKILKGPAPPRRKHEIILFFNREWYRLRWRRSVLNSYREHEVILDTMLLNEKVLRDVLGITDIRNDARIQYVEGPLRVEGVRQRTLLSEYNIGFCLYPVQWNELTRLVDAGEVLPPKSTWFEPRMKNGLVVYTLD
jgi:uncharacterized protein (DUF1015 family)